MRREIRQLARNFADDLVDLLDGAGFWSDAPEDDDDFGNRRVRRSSDALNALAQSLLDDLGSRQQAAAISDIATSLGLSARDIAHPLSLLVERGLVNRSGEKRGTRYQLAPKRRRRKKPSSRPRSSAAKGGGRKKSATRKR